MDDREKQVLFLKKLRETKAKADENGKFITEAELEKAFADLDLDGAQQKQVKDYLKSSGIGIGEALSFEEVSTQEERDYLAEYETMIGTIELPSDNVLDAVRQCSLRKVIDIARLYAGQGVYVEDLIGTGNETLLRAVTQLAPLEKPEEVDGYLGRRIMDAMEDLIAQNLDEKAVEKEVEDKVNLLADRAKELAQMLGRKVSVQELADEYKMDPDEIEEVIKLSGNAIGDIQ